MLDGEPFFSHTISMKSKLKKIFVETTKYTNKKQTSYILLCSQYINSNIRIEYLRCFNIIFAEIIYKDRET